MILIIIPKQEDLSSMPRTALVNLCKSKNISQYQKGKKLNKLKLIQKLINYDK